MVNTPITVSIERTVDPARIAEATAWMQTGIEGWFDEPTEVTVEHAGGVADIPPRWKQAVTIWLGFVPLNLLFTYLVTMLAPGWDSLPLVVRVLVTTVCLTPVMVYALLPLVTRALRGWLTPTQ
ncbi:hypothetical protein [Salinibacterium sp. TMP30]|uniref:hypothetical protein n=1 Tax=Salinibacterium sp. TMP30 TaxID=3138237 RepID=UPI003139A787